MVQLITSDDVLRIEEGVVVLVCVNVSNVQQDREIATSLAFSVEVGGLFTGTLTVLVP